MNLGSNPSRVEPWVLDVATLQSEHILQARIVSGLMAAAVEVLASYGELEFCRFWAA